MSGWQEFETPAVGRSVTPYRVSCQPPYIRAKDAPGKLVASRFLDCFTLPASNNRYIPLDGLRGVAVLLVFLIHFHACISRFLLHGARLDVSSRLANIGYMGVYIFFALSGFLIYGGLIRKPAGYWKYQRRRIKRIYPTFLAVFVIYIAICALVPPLRKWPAPPIPAAAYFVENLLLLPGMFPILPIVTVAWTLSVELFFYLTIPIVINVAGLRSWSPVHRATLWVFTVPLLMWIGNFGGGGLSCTVMFGAGIVAYELTQVAALKRLQTLPGEIAVILLFGAATLTASSGTSENGPAPNHLLFRTLQTAFLWFALTGLVWFSLRAGGAMRALLTLRPIRFMGHISYSYYLVHGAVLHALQLVFLTPTNRPLVMTVVLLPLSLVATISSACVLFALVEFPFSLGAGANAPASRTF